MRLVGFNLDQLDCGPSGTLGPAKGERNDADPASPYRQSPVVFRTSGDSNNACRLCEMACP
jgi:hypothetical protein